jgi:hypothetical protein
MDAPTNAAATSARVEDDVAAAAAVAMPRVDANLPPTPRLPLPNTAATVAGANKRANANVTDRNLLSEKNFTHP